jgi:hypothetical protein
MMNLNIELEKGSGWVTVFPRGKHFINKYQMVLNCDERFFNSVKAWWDSSTFKKPYLDKDHSFQERYGEFTDYRITDKGLELFLVLNDEGKELVKSGKYQYLSPTFDDANDSNGKPFKNVIFSVSLVNYPALLVLDKIQNQIALSFEGEIDKTKIGGSGMELREIVAGKLKLSLAADDSSILAKLEELINSGATIEDLKGKIEMMKAELESKEMELKKVEGEKEEAENALSVIKEKAEKEEAVKVVDEAIKCGQFHPSLKELKVSAYLSDKESVMKELALLPKKDGDKKLTVSGNDTLELSADDKKMLEAVGYDLSKPEDMALAKKFLQGVN